MARRKGRATSVRSPTKSMEKELVRKAELLAKDPSRVLPKIIPPCAKDPFAKVRRNMERVARFADNEERLKKLASRGDEITKAFAGTLMLGAAGKAPYLASLKTPRGEVFYAMRGKAKKEKLAGMQWYDHPEFRLLLYLDMAVRRPHLHFYSTRKTLYCSCKEARPPQEYVEFALSHPRAQLTKVVDKVMTCPHLDTDAVKAGEPIDGTYLRLIWRSAGWTIGVCRRCARSSKDNTLGAIARHMAVPSLEEDFDVRVLHRLEGAGDCPPWDRLAVLAPDEELVDEYVKGQVDDVGLVDRHLERVGEELRGYRGAHFILENRCYCDDVDAFLDALKPSDEERLALEAILPDLDHPLVLDRATPAKVLAELWDEHGEDALRAVVDGDEELMQRYLDHPDVASSPSIVLKRALVDHRKRNIVAKLPDYARLPTIARFADRVARTYHTEGSDGAMRTLEREKGSDTRIKSVAYAFLLAMGREASKKWQYAKTEIDFANFLKDRARTLLDAKPDEYHRALQDLLAATGSTERIPEPEGG